MKLNFYKILLKLYFSKREFIAFIMLNKNTKIAILGDML